MLTPIQEGIAAHAAMAAIAGIGTMLRTDQAPTRLNVNQRSRMFHRNVMTPRRLAIIDLGDRIVELALGDFMNKPIYGLTVFNVDNPDRDFDDGLCCHTPEEITAKLNSLIADGNA